MFWQFAWLDGSFDQLNSSERMLKDEQFLYRKGLVEYDGTSLVREHVPSNV